MPKSENKAGNPLCEASVSIHDCQLVGQRTWRVFTNLSVGVSDLSHRAKDDKACRDTSTSLEFLSSAIAFMSSVTCGLYNDGPLRQIYVKIASALLANNCA